MIEALQCTRVQWCLQRSGSYPGSGRKPPRRSVAGISGYTLVLRGRGRERVTLITLERSEIREVSQRATVFTESEASIHFAHAASVLQPTASLFSPADVAFRGHH